MLLLRALVQNHSVSAFLNLDVPHDALGVHRPVDGDELGPDFLRAGIDLSRHGRALKVRVPERLRVLESPGTLLRVDHGSAHEDDDGDHWCPFGWWNWQTLQGFSRTGNRPAIHDSALIIAQAMPSPAAM